MKKILHSILLGGCLIGASLSALNAETKVKLIKTPNEGIQPKVIVDDSGTVHLVYYKGDAQSGNIYYTRKDSSGNFSSPMRINSVPDSSVAMGTIRGAQFAVDKHNRIHVVWNGSRNTKPENHHGPPMFYARLKEDGSVFEKQRIISGDWPVDGGGAVAVDATDRVFIFWHSGKEGAGDANRNIYARISTDQGTRFGSETVISPKGAGVCGCCAMQATVDSRDNVYVVYRTARNGKQRDINLLMSQDGGANFSDEILDKWALEACPMSSMSFCETDKNMLVGWETEQQVRFLPIDLDRLKTGAVTNPSDKAKSMKHPAFASSPEGDVLWVWAEGTGWKQGGTVAWQLYDSSGKSAGRVNRSSAEVAMWSFLAAYYDHSDNTFLILH
jgi:hypothetical protein